MDALKRKLLGYYRYYGITDNTDALQLPPYQDCY